MTWLSVAFRQGMCIFLVPNFFKWAKCRPLFVYLCPYLNRNVNVLQNSSINEKSVDGVLGIRTRGPQHDGQL